jgi:hypothetical protein
MGASRPSVESSARHVTDTLWVNQVSYVLFAGLRIRWEIAQLLIDVRSVEPTERNQATAKTANQW